MNRWFSTFDPLLVLQEKLANLGPLSPFFGNMAAGQNIYPAINVFEKNGDLVLMAELPGINKDDLQITAEKDTLRISGKRSIRYEANQSVHRLERGGGQFDRAFHLPFNVDINKTVAEYKDGILTVTLKRSEKDQPKRISIGG